MYIPKESYNVFWHTRGDVWNLKTNLCKKNRDNNAMLFWARESTMYFTDVCSPMCTCLSCPKYMLKRVHKQMRNCAPLRTNPCNLEVDISMPWMEWSTIYVTKFILEIAIDDLSFFDIFLFLVSLVCFTVFVISSSYRFSNDVDEREKR